MPSMTLEARTADIARTILTDVHNGTVVLDRDVAQTLARTYIVYWEFYGTYEVKTDPSGKVHTKMIAKGRVKNG